MRRPMPTAKTTLPPAMVTARHQTKDLHYEVRLDNSLGSEPTCGDAAAGVQRNLTGTLPTDGTSQPIAVFHDHPRLTL